VLVNSITFCLAEPEGLSVGVSRPLLTVELTSFRSQHSRGDTKHHVQPAALPHPLRERDSDKLFGEVDFRDGGDAATKLLGTDRH